MEQDHKFYIPKYIDEPTRIVFFSIDELVISLVSGFIAYTLSNEIFGFIAAVCAYFGYCSVKGKESSAYIQRWVYWHLGFSSQHYIPKAKIRHYKG